MNEHSGKDQYQSEAVKKQLFEKQAAEKTKIKFNEDIKKQNEKNAGSKSAVRRNSWNEFDKPGMATSQNAWNMPLRPQLLERQENIDAVTPAEIQFHMKKYYDILDPEAMKERNANTGLITGDKEDTDHPSKPENFSRSWSVGWRTRD